MFATGLMAGAPPNTWLQRAALRAAAEPEREVP